MDKQVSELSATVTKLEQETAQSKEAVNSSRRSPRSVSHGKNDDSIKTARKLEQGQTSFKADQEQSLAQLKATLTKLQRGNF